MIVMMMAMTPSLNASSRDLPIARAWHSPTALRDGLSLALAECRPRASRAYPAGAILARHETPSCSVEIQARVRGQRRARALPFRPLRLGEHGDHGGPGKTVRARQNTVL